MREKRCLVKTRPLITAPRQTTRWSQSVIRTVVSSASLRKNKLSPWPGATVIKKKNYRTSPFKIDRIRKREKTEARRGWCTISVRYLYVFARYLFDRLYITRCVPRSPTIPTPQKNHLSSPAIHDYVILVYAINFTMRKTSYPYHRSALQSLLASLKAQTADLKDYQKAALLL